MDSGVYTSPLFWAVFIGWLLSVVLHEFAHGLVGFLGGDYSIRERGGLTLNPLQYIDPVNSIVLPMLFLLLGGIPLPGGATYVNRHLLRSKHWDAAVSLAGPAMNLLLFFACALPLHPKIGWIHPASTDVPDGPAAVLATLAVLQLIGMMFNLIPVPPLDGFGVISAYMDEETRIRLYSPQVVMGSMLVLFAIVWQVPFIMERFYTAVFHILRATGFDADTRLYFFNAFNAVLFGRG